MELKTKMNLKVNSEYEGLVPRPSAEQYAALKKSIYENGLLLNIEVLEDGTIVDGHTRFRICSELGLTVPDTKITILNFANEWETKAYVVNVNLERRHLSSFQLFELGMVKKKLYHEHGIEIMSQAGKMGRAKQLGVSSNELKPEVFHTDEQLAKDTGLSTATIKRATVVFEQASEAVKEQVRDGDMSISHAYGLVKPKPTAQRKYTIAQVEAAYKAVHTYLAQLQEFLDELEGKRRAELSPASPAV